MCADGIKNFLFASNEITSGYHFT